MDKISIIMPVYNEAKTLALIVPKVLAAETLGLTKELIIVEGGSKDGSNRIVDELEQKYEEITVLHINHYCGKGFKVRQGIKKSTGDILLIQDADLEYDPNDYKDLIQPILDQKAEFVLGSRHLGAGTWKIRKFVDAPIKSKIINFGALGLNTVFNILNGVWLTDPQTMYKVFTKESIEKMKFTANHFDFDWEIVTKLIKKGYNPMELPISYVGRSNSEGKKIRLRTDGFRNLWSILKYKWGD